MEAEVDPRIKEMPKFRERPEKYTGKCFVVKDNIDTDQIIPAEYLTLVPSKVTAAAFTPAVQLAGALKRCASPVGFICVPSAILYVCSAVAMQHGLSTMVFRMRTCRSTYGSVLVKEVAFTQYGTYNGGAAAWFFCVLHIWMSTAAIRYKAGENCTDSSV